ncbi:hypothetical protein T4A_3913 [Trichinella pseudospiralis]|uniref:Uncharacterized protein n=1 Tax=Trichinella pseudospiralis TaxID=6337 RepID=A0A0V1EPX7_TRIPS|nr:hypothetical protein T4A_3913 [Trichinella pseudospiralis]
MSMLQVVTVLKLQKICSVSQIKFHTPLLQIKLHMNISNAIHMFHLLLFDFINSVPNIRLKGNFARIHTVCSSPILSNCKISQRSETADAVIASHCHHSASLRQYSSKMVCRGSLTRINQENKSQTNNVTLFLTTSTQETTSQYLQSHNT